jgi:isopenicillin-N N-acyltransferase like protein
MKLIDISGNHYSMGLQHGRKMASLGEHVRHAMTDRLALLDKLQVDVRPFQKELFELWEADDQPLIEMMRGIAAGLELEWASFFRYSIASYLFDRAQKPIPGQGCTCWAASGSITVGNSPILAKNRDFRVNHRRLQFLVQARPEKGYRYTYLTSAGSPGVFSSGMNEKGLAVADTHVISTDTGPGLARYSVMMRILEHCSGVPEALDYLHSAAHLGDGTLTLIDADGEAAVFEAGHQCQGVIRSEKGYVAATNHFVSPKLDQNWLDISPMNQKGNTWHRYAAVQAALETAQGAIDYRWARKLMASHTDPLKAICRHPEYEPGSVTISTVFFLPTTKTIRVAGGLPCRSAFATVQINRHV